MTMSRGTTRSIVLLAVALVAGSCTLMMSVTEAFVAGPNINSPLPSSTTTLFAKKKKGNKKKNAPKNSGFAWATSFTLQPYEAQATRELVSTAVASFQGRTGEPLCDDVVGVADVPKALWKTDSVACVILDSDTSTIKYANVAALETVGLTANDWDKLMENPKPPPSTANSDQEESSTQEVKDESASQLTLDLPSSMEKAYESGYQKKMLRQYMLPNEEESQPHDISILNAHRWKLEKSALVDGKFVTTSLGVAYAWKEWMLDDDTVRAPGGQRKQAVNVQVLQQQLDEQASKIRKMKEEEGLGNQDPQVKEAVAELLRLKELLAGHS